MCIQMTQATILMQKEGREVIEGEFQTIVQMLFKWSNDFGDINVKEVRLLN
jgi:hypothetical protein